MARPEPRVLFLHGVNYWNLGDAGIFQAMAQSLHRRLGPRWKATILTTFAMPDKPRDIELPVEARVEPYPIFEPVHGMGARLRMLLLLLGLPVLARLYLRGDRARMRRWFPRSSMLFETYLGADLVVSKGGNFLLDTGHRIPTWALPLHQMLLGVVLERPVVLYAQSLGPFRRRWALPIVRAVVERTSLLLIRERGSLDAIPGLEHRGLHVTCDEAFLLEPAAALPPDLEALLGPRTIGATAIRWEFPGAGPEEAEARRVAYYEAMARALDALIEAEDADVLFVPHLVGWRADNDREAIEAIRARSRHAERMRAAPDSVTPTQSIRLLQGCRVFVGTRMHSVIFSIVAGTPVLAVGYLPKTQGTMDLVGLGDWVLPIEGLDAAALEQRLRALLHDPAAPARVRAAREQARAMARQNAELAAGLVVGHGPPLAAPAAPAARAPEAEPRGRAPSRRGAA